MSSQTQFELIEAYLNQELSPSDQRSFEQEMASDEALQVEVATYRSLRFGLRGLAIERRVRLAHDRYKTGQLSTESASLRPDLEQVAPASTGPFTVQRTPTQWRRWAAAASVVVGLGLGTYWYQQATYPAHLSYADNSLALNADQLTKGLPTGLQPAEQQQLLKAIEQYKAGRYDAVIEQLSIPPADRKSEHYRRYFLGLTYLANDQPAKAIQPLQDALVTPSVPLRQKADWFLALAYLKNEQTELATPMLNRIGNDTTHPYHELAKEVIGKLK